MTEERQASKEEQLEQLQNGHRARLDGSILQNLKTDGIQFREVLPGGNKTGANPSAQPHTEQYLNYASQLLEKMRGVYGSSWDSKCNCGNSWQGGYNHFYDPCSGCDVPPSQPVCPPFDCNTNVCCNEYHNHGTPASKPAGCGTTTYYDDCAYKLQQLSDQLSRIETMTKEMYQLNQQLYSYAIEYLNKLITTTKGSKASSCS